MIDIKTMLGVSTAVAVLGMTGALVSPDSYAKTATQPAQVRTLMPYPRDTLEDQVFYFVMPDRFADGDPSNNLGDPDDPLAYGGFDPTDKGMFHGGDIAGLSDKLDYIEGMGVTATWLTPILKNKAVQGDSAGYHGYWTLDFTRLDPHLGSNQEMKAFIEAAHERGIKVFFDIIVNHTADVIKYKECHNADGSHKDGLDSCEYKSKAQVMAGEGYTPFIPVGEGKAKSPAWLNYLTSYHNQGDSTFSGENSLNGDFFGLDDVNTEKPEVVAGMIEIYQNLIREWRPDGFRIDTVKHVNPEFWQAFSPAILDYARNTLGIEDFTMFGEVYSADPAELSFFTTTARLPSVLDFAFQGAAASVVAGKSQAKALDELFEHDDRYSDADSCANQLVKFLGNHDMGRIGMFLKEGSSGDDDQLLAREKLANALMLFTRGVPVFYYGDEQGFTGDGGDKDAREDMFPSQVASYNDNELIGTDATTAEDNFDTSHPLYQSIARLSAIYRDHPVLRRGIQMARPNGDDSGQLFTFSRVDLQAGIEYLLAFNFSPSDSKTVTLPAAATHYQSVVVAGAAPAVVDGKLSFTVPAMDFVILKAEGLAASPLATPDFKGIHRGDSVSGLLQVGVDAPQLQGLALPQYQVRFEASIDGGAYRLLAVDNNAPYRLYWDTSALADGSQVKLRASMGNLVAPPKPTEVTFTVDARSPQVDLIYENANSLPVAFLYDHDGGVVPVKDTDPADAVFTAHFDWGQTPARTLMFADLEPGKPPRVEKPLVLDRNRVMKLAHEDGSGKLVAKLYLNGQGQLADHGNSSGKARELLRLDDGGKAPLPADLNVRGGLNSWGTTPLAYQGQGVYRGSALVKPGLEEFKFADATWGAINLGAPITDSGLTRSANPGNLLQTFPRGGKYDFTVLVAADEQGRQYLLYTIAADPGPFGQPLYLRREQQPSSDDGFSGPMEFDGNRYATEVALSAGQHGFRLADASGDKVIKAAFADKALADAGNGRFILTVNEAGSYRFAVSYDAGADRYPLEVTPAGIRAGAQGPFGNTEILVRGEITGNTPMTYAGDGKYQALVVLDPANTAWGDDGVSAFKIADADWSAVNLGASGEGTVVPGEAKPLAQGSDTNLTLAASRGVYKVVLDASEPKAPSLTLTRLGSDYLVIHYRRADGDYSGWGVHAWGDIVPGYAPEWQSAISFGGQDDFGRFAVVPMTATSKLGFIVHKGDNKNTPADLFFTPSAQQREIWILEGDDRIYDSAAATGQ